MDFLKNLQCRLLINFTAVWTQIRLGKMSGLIWIQTVRYSDAIPKEYFEKVDFGKNQVMMKKHAKLPSRQTVKFHLST